MCHNDAHMKNQHHSAFTEQLREALRNRPGTLLLSEGEDDRVKRASDHLAKCGGLIVKRLVQAEPSGQDEESTSSHPNLNAYAKELFSKRKHKGMTLEKAQELVSSPLYFAALHASAGNADAVVSGATHTTSDVIRAGYEALGRHPGTNTITSTFLMMLSDGRLLTYADCGVVPYPNSAQLADIAITAAATHHRLTGETPRVALLSFSSKGSAEHESVQRVRDALEIVTEREPDLAIDGELQFDAAFVPEIAKRKAPSSSVAGRANVFVFPNLDAGNIAYKITERIGGATAVGPLLRGFPLPWMDLSRGCSAEDIVLTSLIAMLLRD